MQTSLTLGSMLAIFGFMLIGALIPSVSVVTVTVRTATHGFHHGVFTILGILLGDIVFILLAIFGLAVLAESLGAWFVLIKYLGGAYLIGLGITLWRAPPKPLRCARALKSSLLSSFLAGLLITLADQKAILFYLGFFPAFLDLSALSYFDIGLIIVMATAAIGTKLVYAYLAEKASLFLSDTGVIKNINRVAGGIIVIVGIVILLKA